MAPQAKPALLETFHTPEYIEAFKRVEDTQTISEYDRKKYQLGTVSNPISKGMFARPVTSVGSLTLAAELVANGGVAYVMDGCGSLGVARIAYIDLDAHHCDGVQAAFSGDHDFLTISTHEAKRWPFTRVSI